MRNKLLLALALILLSAQAHATVVFSNNAVYPQIPNTGRVQFLQGTDTAGTYKTLYTGETTNNTGQVSDIRGIYATTNDGTAAHLVTCQVVNTAVKYGGTSVTIGGSTLGAAGFANGVPPINLLNPNIWPGLPLDQNGNPFLRLVSGDTLQCTYATTLTTSDVINIVAIASDY